MARDLAVISALTDKLTELYNSLQIHYFSPTEPFGPNRQTDEAI
jgi:hypothetical protein